MTVFPIIIHLYGGAITQRPMWSLEHCEAVAKFAYNENVNFSGRIIAYCISYGAPKELYSPFSGSDLAHAKSRFRKSCSISDLTHEQHDGCGVEEGSAEPMVLRSPSPASDCARSRQRTARRPSAAG